jgi:hypothetical protein
LECQQKPSRPHPLLNGCRPNRADGLSNKFVQIIQGGFELANPFRVAPTQGQRNAYFVAVSSNQDLALKKSASQGIHQFFRLGAVFQQFTL